MSDVFAYLDERIEEIESDERLKYENADVVTNAPLALHQVSQKRALRELRSVRAQLETYREDCDGGDR